MWRNSKTFLKNKRNEKGWYKQILKYFMELWHGTYRRRDRHQWSKIQK